MQNKQQRLSFNRQKKERKEKSNRRMLKRWNVPFNRMCCLVCKQKDQKRTISSHVILSLGCEQGRKTCQMKKLWNDMDMETHTHAHTNIYIDFQDHSLAQPKLKVNHVKSMWIDTLRSLNHVIFFILHFSSSLSELITAVQSLELNKPCRISSISVYHSLSQSVHTVFDIFD